MRCSLSHRPRAAVHAAWAALLLSAGCGGSGVWRQGTYYGKHSDYRLGALNPDWQRVQVEPGNDLAWAHKSQPAVIQVNASCDPALDIPLRALTQHLSIGWTHRLVVQQEEHMLDARAALWTELRARIDGVERALLLVVLKKNGCVYDFALAATPGPVFEARRSDFVAMVRGFHTRGKK
ncbi:MAG: hypothetical protein ACPGUV_09380 [Polyangiales bacterium]